MSSKIIAGLIALILLVGAAGALPRWGPANGFYNPHIQTDVLNASIIGAGITISDTGAIGVDATWAAGKDIKAATGSGEFDWHAATGIFQTSTGTNTLGGDTNLAAGKTFAALTGAGNFDIGRMSGDAHMPTGITYVNATKVTTIRSSGAATLASIGAVNGTSLFTGIATFTAAPVFNAGFTLPAGVDIAATSGASDIDFSAATTGIFKTPGGAVTIGPGAVGVSGDLTMSDGKDIAMTGAGTFDTGTGAVTLKGPVGVAAGVDIVAAGAGSDIDYSLSTTGIFKTPGGAVTIGPGAVGMSGKTTFAKTVNLATQIDNTSPVTISAASIYNVYGIDASGGTVEVDLGDPATMTGRPIWIGTSADPGSNNIVVNASPNKLGGAGGAATLTTTAAAAGITVISDGVNWLVTSLYGSWS